MKEFEKWDKTNKINYATISGGKELCVKNERHKTWRAVLMWLLKVDWGTPDELTELLAQELLNNQTDNSPD